MYTYVRTSSIQARTYMTGTNVCQPDMPLMPSSIYLTQIVHRPIQIELLRTRFMSITEIRFRTDSPYHDQTWREQKISCPEMKKARSNCLHLYFQHRIRQVDFQRLSVLRECSASDLCSNPFLVSGPKVYIIIFFLPSHSIFVSYLDDDQQQLCP